MKGWVKLLLPAWSLPDDKVLKKIFRIPGGQVQNVRNLPYFGSEAPSGSFWYFADQILA